MSTYKISTDEDHHKLTEICQQKEIKFANKLYKFMLTMAIIYVLAMVSYAILFDTYGPSSIIEDKQFLASILQAVDDVYYVDFLKGVAVMKEKQELLLWVTVGTSIWFFTAGIVCFFLMARLCRKVMEEKFKKDVIVKVRNDENTIVLQGISHELKSPITAIQNSSGGTLSRYHTRILPQMEPHKTPSCSDCIGRKFLVKVMTSMQRIDNACQQMSEITINLTNYSNQLREDNTREVDLKQLVLTGVRYSKFSDAVKIIPSESITFEDLQKETPMVASLIPGDVTMVIQNVINNAIYAIQDRIALMGVEDAKQFVPIIQVKLDHDISGKKHIIKITDNGIGMTSDELYKFMQVFESSRKDTNGTGVGLYIVKRNMRKSNGEVYYSSTKYQGTTVELHFPAVDTHNVQLTKYKLTRAVTLFSNNKPVSTGLDCLSLTQDNIELDISSTPSVNFRAFNFVYVQLWYVDSYHLFAATITSINDSSIKLTFEEKDRKRLISIIKEPL